MAILLDEGGAVLLDEGGHILYDEAGLPVSAILRPAKWTFAVIGCASRAFGGRELATATGRTVTWRVDGPASAQFSLDGRSDEAAEIVELATDLVVYRDGLLMFRGRIGPSSDTIDANQHRCQFTAVDYRALLATRITGAAGAVYTGTDDQVAIMWDLIEGTQAEPGGDWGVTYGVQSAPAQLREKTIDPGKPLLDSLNEISRLDNGCEWEINAALQFKTYTARGADNGVVLDYGGLVTGLARQLPMEYANVALVTGGADADGTTPVPVTATTAGVATDPAGRWETSAGYPSTTKQPTLDAKGVWLLGEASVLRPTWSVRLKAGVWQGRAHIGEGDQVLFAVRSGRLQIADPHRVVEINASIADTGDEQVTLGLLAST